MTWTDIHSHILPGFDDGASSEEEFLEMARIAVGGGTSTMVATPHYNCESPKFEPRDVAAAVEEYNGLLKEQDIPLTLIRGLEVMVNAGLLDLAREGGLEEYTIGGSGKYMLVELPLPDVPLATLDTFFQIQLDGVKPILAHPERNRKLQQNPSELTKIIERGVEIQVNSGSLEGLFGKKAQRTARRLITENAAGFVASDAHGTNERSPDMSSAVKLLRKSLGEDDTRVLLRVNPSLVLERGEHNGLEGGR